MKLDFIFHNPTKIYFGKDSFDNLKRELSRYGKKVLFAYGKSSIKTTGLYDRVMEVLKKTNKEVIEFAGIMPNPTYTKMLEGVELVKKHKIDFILAVGGGSVIDCVKGVAASVDEENPWQKYWIEQQPYSGNPLPIGVILTMSGTASEMNGGSVITNEEAGLKVGRQFPPKLFPKFSILNPEITYTLPMYQLLSGIFDTMSHIMEQYFSDNENNVSDYLSEGLLKSVIRNTKLALKNPQDYEARSNLMWAATIGLNRILGCGKTQDWQVHRIEHQLGVFTDCAHGMGLAAITTPYFKHIYKYGLSKFKRFAIEVWDVDPTSKSDDEIALEGIDALYSFIKESGMSTTLKELGTTKEMLPKIAATTSITGFYKKLTEEDILNILESCYE